MPLGFAVSCFVYYNVQGIRRHGAGYIKQFMGPFWWLAWLMLPIEMISHLARMLSLTDDGERYFEDARRLVAEVTEAESRLRQGEQQLTGWLTGVDRLLGKQQRDTERVEGLIRVERDIEFAAETADARHDDAAEATGLPNWNQSRLRWFLSE